jgi:hypothetical protein
MRWSRTITLRRRRQYGRAHAALAKRTDHHDRQHVRMLTNSGMLRSR